MHRKLFFMLSAVLLVAVQFNTALAQENTGTQRQAAEAPMYVDCSRFDEFTAEGQTWAVSNGYCNEEGSDALSPQGTVWGTCGNSQFELADAAGSGNVFVFQSLNSYITGSAIISVQWYYQLYWGDDGFFEYYGDAYPWTTYWSRNAVVDVAPGYVFGFMGGTVELANGALCTISQPYSETTVT